MVKFPSQIDTSIRGRMSDALRAYEAEAFLSAISLALAIPDICGERLCPADYSSNRYAKWFDEYVAPNYPEPIMPSHADQLGEDSGFVVRCGTAPGRYYFAGSDCYQLRCVYLHEGSNAPHLENIEKGKTVYNVIQFRIFDLPGNCDHVGHLEESPSGKVFRQVDLDLRKFLVNLEAGVEAFLDTYPEMNDDTGSDGYFYQPVLDFRDHRASN